MSKLQGINNHNNDCSRLQLFFAVPLLAAINPITYSVRNYCFVLVFRLCDNPTTFTKTTYTHYLFFVVVNLIATYYTRVYFLFELIIVLKQFT